VNFRAGGLMKHDFGLVTSKTTSVEPNVHVLGYLPLSVVLTWSGGQSGLKKVLGGRPGLGPALGWSKRGPRGWKSEAKARPHALQPCCCIAPTAASMMVASPHKRRRVLATPETMLRTEAAPSIRASATPGNKGAHRPRKHPAAAQAVDPREREMRRLLAEAVPTGHKHLDLGCRAPRRILSYDEARLRRSTGVQAILLAHREIQPGARTVALSLHLWDKLLSVTCEVEAAAASPSPHPEHDGGHTSAHTASVAVNDPAVASTSVLEDRPLVVIESPVDSDGLEFPLACFVIACKVVETFAPRLIDVAAAFGEGCTAQQIRDAENLVLSLLSWNVSDVTGTYAQSYRSPSPGACEGFCPRASWCPCLF